MKAPVQNDYPSLDTLLNNDASGQMNSTHPTVEDLIGAPVHHPLDFGRMMHTFAGGAAEGLGRAGINLWDLFSQLQTKALPISKGIFQQIPPNILHILGPQQSATMAAKVGRFAGSTLPFLAIPEAKGAAQLARNIGAYSIGGAALSPQHRVRGAVLGALAEPLTRGALAVPRGAKKLFTKAVAGLGKKGPITFKEALENIRSVPAGIKMPLGDVARSPKLQAGYRFLSKIPFSGSAAPYEQLNLHALEKLHSLTHDIPSNIPDINEAAYSGYKNQYENAKNITSNAFNQLGDLADSSKVKFDRTHFDKAIQEIEKETKSIAPTNPKLYKTVLNFIDSVKPKFKTTLKGAQDLILPNFKSATNLRQRINSLWRDNIGTDAIPLRRALMKAKEGLDKSIEESSVKEPGLMMSLKNANKARIHQGTFERLDSGKRSPFYKIYSDPLNKEDVGNFISNYIKPSKGLKDNTRLSHALLSKLPRSLRSAIGEAHINKNIDPSMDSFTALQKQVANLRDLTPRQRNLLFDEDAPQADDLLKLSRLYPKAKLPGYLPATTGHWWAGIGGVPAFGVQHFLRSNLLKRLYLNALKTQEIGPKEQFLKRLIPGEMGLLTPQEKK